MGKGGVDLAFEGGFAAVPEEVLDVGDVPQGGGVALEGLAVEAEGGGTAVTEAQVGLVATGAGEFIVAGEEWVEEEQTAEFNLGGCAGVFGGFVGGGEGALQACVRGQDGAGACAVGGHVYDRVGGLGEEARGDKEQNEEE